MARVRVRARARRDLRQEAIYLVAQSGSLELGERFLNAANDTFDNLALAPTLGQLCGFTKPALRRVRRWQINGFRNWIVFYIARRNGVEIIHVIHGARDIDTLLGQRE